MNRRYFVDLDDSSASNIISPPVPGYLPSTNSHEAIFLGNHEYHPSSPSLEYSGEECILQQTKSELFYCDLNTENFVKVSFNQKNLLGVGRYSTVYRGILNDQIEVAIKISNDDSESIEDLLNEMEILKILRGNPKIINLIDTTKIFGRSSLVMELGRGTLSDLTFPHGNHSKPSLGLKQIIQYSIDLFTCIRSLERAGIVHLDIKPQNILLTTDGGIKLSDFGASLILPNSNLPKIGTISYCAPELLTTKNVEISDKVNIYSGGVVMYTMLTGLEPFHKIDRSGFALIIAIQKGFFNGDYNLWCCKQSKEVEELVESCTRVDALLRPTSVEVLEKLYLIQASLNELKNDSL